jgi:Mn2+/Fe2+ NRAMP family transporter
MGPGLILSAAIVGSGELILTTTLGAKAGFALLWVVLLGCVVKVAVQVEYGRHCILHGVTTYQAWNGLRNQSSRRGLHWTVKIGVAFMLANMAGQSGVLGGAAQVVEHVIPDVPLGLAIFGLAGIIGLILAQGRYEPVELVATMLNVIFVGTVLACVVALQWTPYRWTLGDLAGGFTLQLEAKTLALAVAAFGITGVAAGEIAMYPYWCLEKGYARWTGPREESPEWVARARGWTRVMVIDAGVSMAVYTVATCGFYILGASVLHQETTLHDGDAFIVQLSQMFTEVLGPGARWLFLICAFTVLFSTVFANAAGFSRLWTDCFGLLGWLDWQNTSQRARWTAWVAALFALACAVIYLFVRKPLLLVTFMGLCNALFLLVVGYQAVWFRYGPSDPRLRPGRFYDLALWVSLLTIGLMAVRTVANLVN